MLPIGGVPLPPLPGRPAVEIIARGLDNPRGLAFGTRGELYVAEAGRGGTANCRNGVCEGRTGAITVVEFGRQWRVGPSLPSVAPPSGSGARGPSDITVGPDGELVHTAVDGLHRGPNLIAAADGLVAVLDTGRTHLVLSGDALLRVTPRGRLQTVAAIAGRAVAAGPDGAYYVAGADRVWRIRPGGQPSVYATGFTEVADLAWAPDGRLYVLEKRALIRVDGGHRTPVAAGLSSPGGLALRGGYAYVTDCGTCKGAGTVLRIRL